eukprot:CAMPEP_0181100058 /NCGR_PEP_ID=MMETSP1071-20121207/12992_1 /TAXON_ID=35127 /ORGANISM="Thalassiosira sp., Strain NH16" /LENGTH=527 /DNA_ID=CAMNT_0023182765 /DNA_START=192 /DNA_END=1775 /DNA_ORIENTATION=-
MLLSRTKILALALAATVVVALVGTPVCVRAEYDSEDDYDSGDDDFDSEDDDVVVVYPPRFNLEKALDHYGVESTSLLRRSMLIAGFSFHETSERDESYLDFAERALVKEITRIDSIRDSLYMRKLAAGYEEEYDPDVDKADVDKADAAGTCSAEDGECKEGPTTSTTKNDSKLSPEFGHFLTPDLKSGQADLLRWERDGSIVQEYAVRVGLPPRLVPTLKEYAEGLGLLDIMTSMLYDDPLPPNGARWFSFQSPYQKEITDDDERGEMRNFTWNVERPAKNWKSDMHWFNTADELSHEDGMRALARGGFDEVLAGIGEMFDLDTLHVDSFGFVAVTNCERGYIHTDWENTGGNAFNFLVGIHSPEDAGPELVVEGEKYEKGEVYYGSNAGVLVGDGTRHGTRECDHRAKRGVRITCSIYLANPTKDNLSILAGDTTSVFPPMEDVGEEWIWSHKGRHWRREGGGDGLVGDLGRTPFEFEDDGPGCTKEHCNNELRRGRNTCMKTCKVFMDDESEYKPGKERREVLGY